MHILQIISNLKKVKLFKHVRFKNKLGRIVKTLEIFLENEVDGNGNFRFYPNPPNMVDIVPQVQNVDTGVLSIWIFR